MSESISLSFPLFPLFPLVPLELCGGTALKQEPAKLERIFDFNSQAPI